MKFRKNLVWMLVLMLICFCSPKSLSEEDGTDPITPSSFSMRVMSFNIRYLAGDTGTEFDWSNRKGGVASMLAEIKPVVVGTQEGYVSQINDIISACPQYKAYAVARDGYDKENETNAILYLKDSVSIQDFGTFWLSNTPSRLSMGWDAACTRICSYAKMKFKRTGDIFYFFNTHLDHVGETARREGLRLIWTKMEEFNPEHLPVILTGDFNTTIDDSIFDWSPLRSARETAPESDDTPSYNAFGKGKTKSIDHIFYSGFDALLFKTITQEYGGSKYISDHYPIICEIKR